MTKAKPSEVRFYVDADLLGTALILGRLRPDLTYPGDKGAEVNRHLRPECPVRSAGAKDGEWIPIVAERGWIIITRDRAIQDRPLELAAVRDYGAKMVNLPGKDAHTKWHQLEIIFSQWRRIEALVDEPGPFIYSATRSGFRRLEL